MRIRTTNGQDSGSVRELHMSAFPEGEGELVATLAVNLLAEETVPPTLSFLAEEGDAVIGHVVFSPVTIDGEQDLLVYILAPLAVSPEHQKGGVGSSLVKGGMEHLVQLGVDVVLVYGDPAYYRKFGFSDEVARNFTPPYLLKYPTGWQARVIRDGGLPEKPARISCVSALNDPGLW